MVYIFDLPATENYFPRGEGGIFVWIDPEVYPYEGRDIEWSQKVSLVLEAL